MSDQGTLNKSFNSQMNRHRLAWKLGTKEYTKRKDYPGDAARNHVCTNKNCLNYQWHQPAVSTFWLCLACSKIAPCIVTEFYTHAPFKMLPPRKKQQAACSAAFAAWCLQRKKPSIPKPDKTLTNISGGHKQNLSN